jgi:hypothetical protein
MLIYADHLATRQPAQFVASAETKPESGQAFDATGQAASLELKELDALEVDVEPLA